jgi:KaiC/GvpD/RAD55 family RecA-like ATPase
MKPKRKFERIESGVPGLDKLIQGGFIKGSTILVSGEAGAGKTTFCLQYLWEGLQKGEPGIYITLEETAEEIRQDALSYGWDLSEYEKKDMFLIIEKNMFEDPDIDFFEIDKLNAKRLVIDSISILSLMIDNKAVTRNRIGNMLRSLKEKDVTTLLISESAGASDFSRLGIEEYIADAVILLELNSEGKKAERSLFVRKMRRTMHSESRHQIKITPDGMSVGVR